MPDGSNVEVASPADQVNGLALQGMSAAEIAATLGGSVVEDGFMPVGIRIGRTTVYNPSLQPKTAGPV